MFKAQTEWNKPEEFPDLRECTEISIDLETYDPDLKSKGSGSVVDRGKVVGIAVATNGYAGYFPFDHKGGGNLEKAVHFIEMIIERDYPTIPMTEEE